MVLWVSNDGMLRLGVIKIAIPSHIKLVRSSAEEGFAEEIGGTITASSSVVKNGHEIWLMTAKGSAHGVNIQITQAMVQYNANVYKVMAANVGDAPIDETTINTFVNSIDIKAVNPNSDTGRAGSDGRRQNGHIDLHNLSKTIGGVGALLLMGIIVCLLVRRGKNKP